MSEPIGASPHAGATRVARLVAARVYGGAVARPGPGVGGAGKNRLEAGPTGQGPEAGVTGHRLEAGSTGPLPFYRNPAARAEAATLIAVGRILDTRG